jgi:hypothetical protein
LSIAAREPVRHPARGARSGMDRRRYHLVVVDEVGDLSERASLMVAEVRAWLGGSTP